MRLVDRARVTLVLTFLTSALAACGGGDDEDESASTADATGSGAAGGAGGGADVPCNSVSLQGTLDGDAVDAVFAPQGHSFTQFDVSQFTVAFGAAASGALMLEWPGLEFSGATFDATGSLLMPSDGPHQGATLCAGEGSTLLYEKETCAGQEITHYVAELVSPASGPACPGASHVEGSVVFELRSD